MVDKLEGDGSAGAPQKSRHRSPNYPSIGLRAAVGKIEALYKAGGLAPLMKITALKQMGFEKAEGDAARVLSAVRNFGLIEEMGEDRLKLTQRGIDIVARQHGDPQRSVAIRAAVSGPPIYRELLTEYAASGIPPDAALKSELVAAKRFNPNAVDGFIRDFRDTLEFAGLSDVSMLGLDIEEGKEPNMDALQEPIFTGKPSHGKPHLPLGAVGIPARQMVQEESPNAVRQDVFSLPEGTVTIQWPTSLGPESFEDFSAWLDILKRKIGRSVSKPENRDGLDSSNAGP